MIVSSAGGASRRFSEVRNVAEGRALHLQARLGALPPPAPPPCTEPVGQLALALLHLGTTKEASD